MNELNIYARYNYKELVRNANLFFNKKYCWYNPQTVFAPNDGKFSLAIRPYNIHLSYWDEDTKQGKNEKRSLKHFLENNIKNMTIALEYDKKCDITNLLEQNNILL